MVQGRELKVLLTIKYEAMMQGFDAPKAQPDATQASKEKPKETATARTTRAGGRTLRAETPAPC